MFIFLMTSSLHSSLKSSSSSLLHRSARLKHFNSLVKYLLIDSVQLNHCVLHKFGRDSNPQSRIPQKAYKITFDLDRRVLGLLFRSVSFFKSVGPTKALLILSEGKCNRMADPIPYAVAKPFRIGLRDFHFECLWAFPETRIYLNFVITLPY